MLNCFKFLFNSIEVQLIGITVLSRMGSNKEGITFLADELVCELSVRALQCYKQPLKYTNVKGVENVQNFLKDAVFKEVH